MQSSPAGRGVFKPFSLREKGGDEGKMAMRIFSSRVALTPALSRRRGGKGEKRRSTTLLCGQLRFQSLNVRLQLPDGDDLFAVDAC